MNRPGMTLIEVSIMTLVATILFHAALSLMFLASERFGKQEESIICANNASKIISRLRSDFDNCIASGSKQDMFDFARSTVKFKDQVLEFKVLDSKSSHAIQYVFDEKNRMLTRNDKGVSVNLGDHRISKFFVVYQLLCDDGAIRSFPFDPEITSPEPQVFPATKAVRGWVKILLTLEEKSKGKQPTIKQDYNFKLFPYRLNRQLQSIWAQ
ncbi:hypothetical protein HYY75_11750 [bacterium]|nr:hypothetical protein [bacterium]